MNLNLLKKVFEYLPNDIITSLNDTEFKTCWYASAGMDTIPFELLSQLTPNGLLNSNVLENEKVRVFFYTDIAYNFDRNNQLLYGNYVLDFESGFGNGNHRLQLIRPGTIIKEIVYFYDVLSTKVVRYDINGNLIYCFFISTYDHNFENIMICENLTIDVVCHAGGFDRIGGPMKLEELNVEYYLGHFNQYLEDNLHRKYNLNILSNTANFGLHDNGICNFYKLVKKNN